jgi:hypothetical protein
VRWGTTPSGATRGHRGGKSVGDATTVYGKSVGDATTVYNQGGICFFYALTSFKACRAKRGEGVGARRCGMRGG